MKPYHDYKICPYSLRSIKKTTKIVSLRTKYSLNCIHKILHQYYMSYITNGKRLYILHPQFFAVVDMVDRTLKVSSSNSKNCYKYIVEIQQHLKNTTCSLPNKKVSLHHLKQKG